MPAQCGNIDGPKRLPIEELQNYVVVPEPAVRAERILGADDVIQRGNRLRLHPHQAAPAPLRHLGPPAETEGDPEERHGECGSQKQDARPKPDSPRGHTAISACVS